MKYICCLQLISLILFSVTISAQVTDDSTARQFLKLNETKKYNEAVKLFDKSSNVSDIVLKQAWGQLEKMFGNYNYVIKSDFRQPDTIVEKCDFERAFVNIKFVFNREKLIIGFFVIKVVPKATRSSSDSSGFKQEEVTMTLGTGQLYGLLMLSDSNMNRPVALIIPGSGPIDKNGNSFSEQSNVYKQLAESLAQHGIASLRYDKRGIGKSAAAMQDPENTVIDDYIEDAINWMALLKRKKEFSKFIIIGHSEGALIGMLVAKRIKVDALISIAGPGERLDSLLLTQFKSKLAPNDYTACKSVIDTLRKGKVLHSANALIASLLPISIQHFIISTFKYRPLQEIAEIKIPTLIIQGKKDLQVPVQDAKKLADANPSAHLLLIDNMTHMLKDVQNDDLSANYATYKDPSLPLDNTLVITASQFIKSLK